MAGTVVGPVGTLGAVPSITCGGQVLTDFTNLIVLNGLITSGGQYMTLRLPSSSSGYTVTTGKTLTIWAGFINSTASTSSNSAVLMSSTGDVNFSSASAPSGAVGVSGPTAFNTGIMFGGQLGTSGHGEFGYTGFQIAAGLYVSATLAVAGSLTLYCYET